MADLGCQDTDWEGKNDRGFRRDFTARWALTSHLVPNVVILSAFLVGLWP